MTERVVIFYTATIGFALGVFARSFLNIGLPEIAFVMVLSFGVGVLWRRNSEAVSAPDQSDCKTNEQTQCNKWQ